MLAVSVVVALGACLLAPPADAVSLKHTDKYQPTAVLGHRIGFFLGEDAGIWYTVIDTGGLSGRLTTGNEKNPFDQGVAEEAPAGCTPVAFATCSGFVRPTGLAGACTATGDTCAGIYARIPGPGAFLDTVMTDNESPLCFTQLNIIATGGDNNFWYTLFDIGGALAGGIGGGPGGGVCPGKDPFTAAGEDKNAPFTAGGGSGFVNQPALAVQCTTLSRPCVGVWARFP